MVLDCNCVTYDEATGFTFAGVCFYNCMNNAVNADRVYHILPKKAFDLNCSQSACSWFNRKGLLCGEYDKGFSPFVISYDLMQLHEVSRWRQELVEVCCNCFYCSHNLLFDHSHLQNQCNIFLSPWSDLVQSDHLCPCFNFIIPDTCLNVSPLQPLHGPEVHNSILSISSCLYFLLHDSALL